MVYALPVLNAPLADRPCAVHIIGLPHIERFARGQSPLKIACGIGPPRIERSAPLAPMRRALCGGKIACRIGHPALNALLVLRPRVVHVL
jgi:hypothetical protein